MSRFRTPDPPAGHPSSKPPGTPPRRVEVREGAEDRLAVRFRYAPDLIARIKEIPGRRWHQRERHWSIPAHTAALALLLSKFRAEDLVLARRVERLLPRSGLEQVGWRRLDPTRRAVRDARRSVLDRMHARLATHGYARSTKDAYLDQARRFLEFADVHPADLRAGHLQKYVYALLVERKLSHSYVNQVVSAVKFLLSHVLHRSLDGVTIPRPKPERKLPVVLSKSEVRAIFEAVENRKHRAILMIAYSAGLRVREVVALKVSDLDADRGMLHIRQSKGRKDRYVPLSKVALEAVRLYRKYHPSAGPWLFPGQKPGRHLSERTVQKLVARARDKAGLEKKPTPHTLRHTFATHLHESGIGIRYIQELLGHKSSKTTEIYTHISRANLRKIQSPLDQLMDPSRDARDDQDEDEEGEDEDEGGIEG